MPRTGNSKSTKSSDQRIFEPCIEIIYQRLNDYAPQMDIDPERGCVDFISNTDEEIPSGSDEGGQPLRFGHLRMPATTLGIVVPSVSRLVVANPILCAGFDGELDILTFHALQYDVTIAKGRSICSLFLIPCPRSSFKIREITAVETLPARSIKEALSMELICSAGSFTTSRRHAIAAAMRAERDRENAARRFALNAEIRQKIKITPIPGDQIPPELVERFVTSIIEHDHFDSIYRENPSKQYWNHTYEIVQFPTEAALEERLAAAKNNGHYWHYQKEKLKFGNLYYGFLIEASAKNPYD